MQPDRDLLSHGDAVAVVGMACRFPRADSPEQLWRNLSAGLEAISFFSPESLRAAGVDPDWLRHPGYVPAGGVLDGIELFDAELFGLTPREAAVMDPQHRLLLECAWEALETAGYPPGRCPGSVGVFAGSRISEYLLFHQEAPDLAGLGPGSPIAHFQALIANDKDYLATRISHALDLKGPSLSVQTACSTSLVAVHLACQSLLGGECDLALAGGVSVRVPQTAGYLHSEGMIFSPDGHTRAFDAAAGGTLFSSGAGLVALRRLADAIADGDPIRAVIRGSAVNNDGAAAKAGYTAPSPRGQAEVVREALAVAGVPAETIRYVEAHGTGTPLGDPIEIAALTEAFGAGTAARGFCAVGSVKTNLGHLVQAAGVAGLIKTVLMLENRKLVPSLHFERPNPQIRFAETPFFVSTELKDWQGDGAPLRAGVSSFGVGGTNAHVVLEEAPAADPDPAETPGEAVLLPLSAANEPALAELAGRFERHLAAHPALSLARAGYTAGAGRRHLARRLAVVAASPEEMAGKLVELAASGEAAGTARGGVEPGSTGPRIAFLFTGQGAQYAGMGRQLYETEPVFRHALDHCAELLRPDLDRPLLAVLYPASGEESLLDETVYTQAALFALGVALAELWRSWGVTPHAVLGHSVGEIAAACAAGALGLEDAARLVGARGRLMQGLPRNGRMAAVFSPEGRVASEVAARPGQVSLAAVNAAEEVVISGDGEAVAQIVERLAGEGFRTRWLPVSHAFHSPLVEPIAEAFEEVARRIAPRAPGLPWISNLTGRRIETADGRYWRRHLRETVRFAAGMESLLAEGCDTFLELGPRPTLLGIAQRCLPPGTGAWLPSLRPGREDRRQMLESLAELYVRGAEPAWAQLHRGRVPRRVALPTYPFQRQRHWIEPPVRRAGEAVHAGAWRPEPATRHALLGAPVPSPLCLAQFEARFRPDAPPFLRDHRVHGRVVFPAVGFLEMALAAAAQALGRERPVLADLTIREALLLPEGETQTLHLVLKAGPEGTTLLEIHARRPDEGPEPGPERWRLHVTGRIEAGEAASPAPAVSLDELRRRCPQELSVAAFYRDWRREGIQHGESFQGIEQLWIGGTGGAGGTGGTGAGEALGRIRATPVVIEGEGEGEGKYRLHPALMSACLQVAEAAAAAHGKPAAEGVVYLPVVWERCAFHAPAGREVWSHARVRPGGAADGPARTLDLRLVDPAGRILLEVEGLVFLRAGREALQPAERPSRDRLAGWIYELEWHPAVRRRPRPGAAPEPGSWLILADRGGVGEALARVLCERGEDAELVFARVAAPPEAGEPGLDPADAAGFVERLARRPGPSGAPPPWRGIVHLWSLDAQLPADAPAGALRDAQLLACGSVLHLVQALGAGGPDSSGGAGCGAPPPRLFLVTRGGQPVGLEREPVAVAQAPLWGLGRVVAQEHPRLRCRLIDLDPAAAAPAAAARALLDEVRAEGDEDQVALRGGARHAPRLVRGAPSLLDGALPERYRLETARRGALEELALQPAGRRPPGPGEVEIEVRANSLNFRDVLNALGQYTGDGPFGFDCAGRVAALGPGVEGLRVGDEVLAIAEGCFGSHALADARLVVGKPASLSFEEAASVPVAFVTASYALLRQGRLAAGERVLIHAAAGGVGLAAVQLALRQGARVFATAGSEEKREYLAALGVDLVASSRTADFAAAVEEATGGRGVDVVLNSLPGDLAALGLTLLAPGGRFVEIGAGALDEGAPASSGPRLPAGAERCACQVSRLWQSDPWAVRSMLIDIVEALGRGELRVLPVQVFPADRVADAFCHMARARQIGKIVVSHTGRRRAQTAERPPVRDDRAYLVTGGLGGIGLRVARRLVEHGARHLLLLGRGAPSGPAREEIARLESLGAAVRTARADVAVREQLARALDTAAGLPPLGGIVHAAGVLDDVALAEQDWERFARVLAPKVEGSWNLHVLTRGQDLDFFILFSSMASLFGPLRRGNYAAASAFLDALAHHRRARGLPATSLDWGSWASVGMSAGQERQSAALESAYGLGRLRPEEGLEAFGRLLAAQPVQAGVISMQWPRYFQRFRGGEIPPFYAELASPAAAPASGGAGAPAHQEAMAREPLPGGDVFARLLAEVSRVLGLSPAALDVDEPLPRLGLDSLMAIELRNRLATRLGVEVPMVKFLEGPSLRAMAALLAERLAPAAGAPGVPEPAAAGVWEEGEL